MFIFSKNTQTGSGTHPASYSMGTWIKQAGREVNHSPPSSVEVKNDWTCTTAPPIRLHDVDRVNFTCCVLR
jgi:hypothetical protein